MGVEEKGLIMVDGQAWVKVMSHAIGDN
jgi:hypothetical protein